MSGNVPTHSPSNLAAERRADEDRKSTSGEFRMRADDQKSLLAEARQALCEIFHKVRESAAVQTQSCWPMTTHQEISG
jgi:hypothetical protein